MGRGIFGENNCICIALLILLLCNFCGGLF